MFYKAARSRAQANGEVGLNHSSIRHLKVRRPSFIIGGGVTGENDRKLGEAKVRFGPAGEASLCQQVSVSETLLNVSSKSARRTLTSQHNTEACIGQASSISHRNTIAKTTHTFHLRQCSYEGATSFFYNQE